MFRLMVDTYFGRSLTLPYEGVECGGAALSGCARGDQGRSDSHRDSGGGWSVAADVAYLEAAVLEMRRKHPSWTTALGSAEARFGSLTPSVL